MRRRWTVGEANRWYAEFKPIRGSKYLLRTAVNSTEKWQANTIDLETIGQKQMQGAVASCRSNGRPVIGSEWLRRTRGNTAADTMPLFARGQVGWYNWGLVAGRTQTFSDWRSKAGDPDPTTWQHDMFHADGTALTWLNSS